MKNTIKFSRECPACGEKNMRKEEHENSLSRYVNMYICSDCGMKESHQGFFWEIRLKVSKLLKSKRPININNKLIIKILGRDDMRDFYEDIGNWGHVTDFTYRNETHDNQRFIRRFLKETYLD